MNSSVFTYSLLRLIPSLLIVVIGIRRHRILPVAFGLMLAFNSVVFAITNAGGDPGEPWRSISVTLTVPIVSLIAIGVWATAPMERARGRWWW